MDGTVDSEHVFWADEIADRIEARNPSEPIVLKGGISPSGIPHLGNANEIILNYFVAEVLRERGYAVRQVFTTDDRDPLRKLPRKLADLEGRIVGLGEVDAAALGRNLGKPYTAIPDPFGCCQSYGDHFSQLIEGIATTLDIPMDVVSTTDLYEAGHLDDSIRTLLADQSHVQEVLSKFQDKVDDEYVAFNPICQECGKFTETVTGVDLERDRVMYRCTDLEIGDQTIEGCGHEGEVDFAGGKLPWRFEWVAQWKYLGVDYEPFGKDHAEGSWPSGVDIAEKLLSVEPPEPMVYEWFTYEGEAFSSSTGHVVLVSEVLELVEPEILFYFFSRDPSRARDFSIERIDLLVDEFDAFEAAYFDPENAQESVRKRAARIYPFLVDDVHPERFRLPYTFAAVLSMVDDRKLQRDIAEREGHIPTDAPDWAIEAALDRVERAGAWAARMDNRFNYRLHRESIPIEVTDDAMQAALADIAEAVEAGEDGEGIQAAIFEAADRHDLETGDLFAMGYRLLFDEADGPKLGPFLAELDREFVVDRFRLNA